MNNQKKLIDYKQGGTATFFDKLFVFVFDLLINASREIIKERLSHILQGSCIYHFQRR